MYFRKFIILTKIIRRLRALFVGGAKSIGRGCTISPTVQLISGVGLSDFVSLRTSSEGTLVIGENVTIGSYSRVVAMNNVVIGDDCMIADFVAILDHDHKFDSIVRKFVGYNVGTVSLGNNVWVGDGVKILKDVRLGSNVIIGANSVVNRSFGDNVIIAGVPARVIKEL